MIDGLSPATYNNNLNIIFLFEVACRVGLLNGRERYKSQSFNLGNLTSVRGETGERKGKERKGKGREGSLSIIFNYLTLLSLYDVPYCT